MLVATSLIEVGIDVPNATVMIVEGAERFGLAQLHQLRGRVGRGTAKSYCLLFSSPRRETPASAPAPGWRRSLETTDGFELADRDLEIRGEGQVMGARQAGRARPQARPPGARPRRRCCAPASWRAGHPRRRSRPRRARQRAARRRGARPPSATSWPGCSRRERAGYGGPDMQRTPNSSPRTPTPTSTPSRPWSRRTSSTPRPHGA